MDSSMTIENKTKLDDLGKAAVAATAAALGVDASNAAAFSLGCGMESHARSGPPLHAGH